MEQWADIPGFGGSYQVSSGGKVRTKKYGDFVELAQFLWGKPGREYKAVSLFSGGARKKKRVHHLVLECFVSERPSSWHQACHNDGDRMNNSLSNLRWDTPRANAEDRSRHGRHFAPSRGSHGMAKLNEDQVSEIRKMLASGARQTDIASKFGVSRYSISHIKLGKNWK